MSNVEALALSYYHENSEFKKNKILQKIFKLYQPLINKLSKKYSIIEEPEVIIQHIYIGISFGLINKKSDESAQISIYRSIRKELFKEVFKPFNSVKTSKGKDICVSDLLEETIDIIDTTSFNNENKTVLKMDIDNAVEKLPVRERTIIKLWMKGYSVKEISRKLEFVNNKSGSIIYYYLNKIKKFLNQSLAVYQYAY